MSSAARWPKQLQRLGSKHVLVVHSQDGLTNSALPLRPLLQNYAMVKSPSIGFSLKIWVSRAKACLVWWSTARSNRWSLIRDALGRRKTEAGQKAAEMIVLNAGAALYAADLAYTLKQGGCGIGS